MPQLIIGLDSLNDDANYIHIDDVREGVDHYCPCCRGLIKPRAYKKEEDYQMQPHFYHESGGCKEETYVHYICKNWLFDKGVKFIVDSNEYEVESIETEKTLHTSFGDYRPDIIVNTVGGKTFYFEIKSTNRKTELYAPKWDELGNDVVEVDVKEFVNLKIKDGIPVFNLIYSDGECFIKSYTKKDYDEIIAARKREWKRQEKINYKIQWERLDWFWETLVSYKRNRNNIEDVLIAFENLDFFDKDFVMTVVKKMKCQELFDSFVPIINNAFWDEVKKIDISPYEGVYLKQESPGIFYVGLQIRHIHNYRWFYSKCIRKKIVYYGIDIFQSITTMIQCEQRSFKLPCYDRFYKLEKSTTLDYHVDMRFYLTDNPMIYCTKDNECYCLNKNLYSSDITGWDINTVLYNKNKPNSLYSEEIYDLVVYQKRPPISRQKHCQNMERHNQKNYIDLLSYSIIKRVNSCSNKSWYAALYNIYGLTPRINIRFRFHENIYQTFDFDIFLINEDTLKFRTKQEIFDEVKTKMRTVFTKTINCYNGENFCEHRIMVEDSNGK